MAEPCPWTVYACDLFRTSSGPHCIARGHEGGALSNDAEYEFTYRSSPSHGRVAYGTTDASNLQGKKSPSYCFTPRPFRSGRRLLSRDILRTANMSAHTCVNMHLDRHQPSRRQALVTHGSDDRTMNNYTTASHTTRLSACGTHRTQMVTVCPARLAIAIYTRVMITSDVVGHAVPYEIPVGKYGVGKSVT